VSKLGSLHKWRLGVDGLIAARGYPGFRSMKRLGVFLLPLDGMLVHHRSLPCNLLGFPNNLLVPIYTPGWSEALWELSVVPKNTTQCPQPGSNPDRLIWGRAHNPWGHHTSQHWFRCVCKLFYGWQSSYWSLERNQILTMYYIMKNQIKVKALWKLLSFFNDILYLSKLRCMGYWPSLFDQDGWILAKFFFCMFMDRDRVRVHKLAEKERGQYSAILTEQAWSIKDLLYDLWGNFSCRTGRVVQSGWDSCILPAQVANHSAGFDSSCPLTELAI